jgi:hypothetical protein
MNDSHPSERRGQDDPQHLNPPHHDPNDPLATPGEQAASPDNPQPETPLDPEPAYQGEVGRDLPQGYALSEPEEPAEASTGDTPAASAPQMIEQKEEAPAPRRPRGPMRSYAVDALRGIAILGMCLSGIVPAGLWNAMYHGYYPQFLPAHFQTENLPDPSATDTQAIDNALDTATTSATDAATAAWGGDWPQVADVTFRGDWPAFTWVDWVFPLFLFAMGVAIPLAYHGRRAKGASWWAYPFQSVWRFLVLVAFALYAQQITPYFIDNPPTFGTWCIALIAFLIPFAIFVRIPKGAPYGAWLSLRLLGIGAAVALLAYINGRPDHAFSWKADWGGPNVDIIILLLAWASLATSLLWYLTRGSSWPWILVRLLIGLPFAFVAHHQSMRSEWRLLGDNLEPYIGPVWTAPFLDLRWINNHLPGSLPEPLLDLTPLYNFGYFKFTFLTIVGTVIGDLIIARARKAAHEPERTVEGWGYARVTAISVLMLFTIILTFIGLKDYATPLLDLSVIQITTPYAALLVLFPLALTLFLVQPATDLWDRHVRVLTWWGTAWLVLGIALAVAPGPAADTAFAFFEGGIKKGPPSTLSWYATSLGLGILLVAWWTMWVDARQIRWPLGLLIANGQNPMLAYVAIRNLLAPLIALPLLAPLVTNPELASPNAWMRTYLADGGPWSLFLWALAQTLLLAIAVWVFTRAKLIWRS